MGILLLDNLNIVTSLVDGKWFTGAMRIDTGAGTILELGPDVMAKEGDERLDLAGQTAIPGLVVGHHHLYSALARGMPAPKQTPSNFPETLEYIWWVLDKALDEETVYLSTVAGLAGAARMGITGIIDHHASPSFISGSLATMAKGFEEFGMRGQLCYEVTDRNRKGEGAEGVDENRRFAQYAKDHRLLRAAVGGHASFTIADNTLDDMASLCAEMDLPIHIHLLEDKSDDELSIDRYGMSPESRLTIRNLFKPGAIIVHGVHLSESKLRKIQESGAFMVNNPRSNMNNRVGRAMVGHGEWALGTDGIDSDILAEARASFFRGREDEPPLDWMAPMNMLKRSQQMLGRPFGLKLGTLAAGTTADITFLDYDPPTPLDADNFSGHLYFGLGSYACTSTMVNGRWVMKDRELVTVDERAILAKSREGARRLYKKMGAAQ